MKNLHIMPMESGHRYNIYGNFEIEQDRLWGKETQRSLVHFNIGEEVLPQDFIAHYAMVKKAAAIANNKLGFLTTDKCDFIKLACDEIIAGKYRDHFPVHIWQTGSGTHTNMNLNEVIANRANQIIGKDLIHPNDDVNRSQSSNDTFPAVIHLAVIERMDKGLIPALDQMLAKLTILSQAHKNTFKVGRTHLMDAIPMSFGQEVACWRDQLKICEKNLEKDIEALYTLPIGGTAIGTGMNAPQGFDSEVIRFLKQHYFKPFRVSQNPFVEIASHHQLLAFSSSLKNLAIGLIKMANDIRLLASGPRTGLAELILPRNEAGSSMMPGKVNPTQCEAMIMVCTQVIGLDTATSYTGVLGQLQLNTFNPMIAHNLLNSIKLLTDVIHSFSLYCLNGLQVNKEILEKNIDNSLMIVTALSQILGHETCAELAKEAEKNNLTIKDVVIGKKLMTNQEYDRYINLEKLVYPHDGAECWHEIQ